MEKKTVTFEKELKKSIFRGWESPNAKNASDIDIKNATMHWGFANAMDNYFSNSRDPKKFVQEIQNAGFSYDWPLNEKETAIARLAIKCKLRMWNAQDKLKSNSQSFLNTLIAVYRSVCDQQEI